MKKKAKTHKTALKRFKITGRGKIVFYRAGKSHLQRKKSKRRKRRLNQKKEVSVDMRKKVRRLVGR